MPGAIRRFSVSQAEILARSETALLRQFTILDLPRELKHLLGCLARHQENCSDAFASSAAAIIATHSFFPIVGGACDAIEPLKQFAGRFPRAEVKGRPQHLAASTVDADIAGQHGGILGFAEKGKFVWPAPAYACGIKKSGREPRFSSGVLASRICWPNTSLICCSAARCCASLGTASRTGWVDSVAAGGCAGAAFSGGGAVEGAGASAQQGAGSARAGRAVCDWERACRQTSRPVPAKTLPPPVRSATWQPKSSDVSNNGVSFQTSSAPAINQWENSV